MKKLSLIFVIALMLCGCSAAPTFETMADDHVQSVMQAQRDVRLTIPEEAEAVAVRGDAGTIYLCDGFEVTAQVLSAGDISGTFRSLTGFESQGLTVMATAATGWTRYECVWTAAGEAGDTVGRAVILDDGVYHYCLTLTADADQVSTLQDIFREIIASYSLA